MLQTGCATVSLWPQPNWHHDFESAQSRARTESAATLVYYSEARPGRHDPLKDALRDPELAAASSHFVRCRLYVSHEPDRRFVGQYGVTRAPAWIVIHPDGTYHSRMGAVASADIAAFIRESQPPGEAPAAYGYLVSARNRPSYSDLSAAEEVAVKEQRPLLVIYTRLMSRDWAKLEPLMNSMEVRRAGTGIVQCRMDIGSPWSETADTKFGPLRLPALVMQHPDGSSAQLEQPNSARSIVELLRRNPNDKGEVSTSVTEPEIESPTAMGLSTSP